MQVLCVVWNELNLHCQLGLCRSKDLPHEVLTADWVAVTIMGSTTEIFLAVAVALIVITWVTRTLFSKQHKLNLPPGPAPLPIIGSLHLLGTHPHKSLTDLAQQYGPVMSIRLGQRDFLVASSPEAAKEFLKLQDPNFSARAPMRAAQIILPQDLALNNITPVFRHLRKVFVSELTSPKRLQASKHVRAEEVAYTLRSISVETGPIQVNTYIQITTSNIISRMVLNKRFLGGEGQTGESAIIADDNDIMEFIYIVKEMTSCFGTIHPQDYFDFVPKWLDVLGLDARFRKLRVRTDLFTKNMINQHKQNRRENPISEDEKTMLDVLLEQLDNKEYDITETHIDGLIWDAFTAGTDTTRVVSEWAMAEVLRHPAVLQQARSEFDRVVGLDRTVQESDIPELKYMGAIIKEAFRLHAPIPMLIPHMGMNPTKAFGYDIPVKTRVLVNVWGMGRDPGIWEKPLEFMPERFLGGVGRDFRGQHYEYTPFGSGRRSCPGMPFATISTILQVASLLHAFDWELPGGLALEKLDMTEGQGFAIPMRYPLVAIAKPRLPSHLY